MSPLNHPPDEFPELEVPERLREDLAALDRAGVDVPREVDEAVLEAARVKLAVTGTRRRGRALRWAAGLAAAACLILVFRAVDFRLERDQKERDEAPVAAVSREDIDRNGRVDILDAFLLARRIESEDSLSESWDVNGDGNVDRGDLDLVAMAAVHVR